MINIITVVSAKNGGTIPNQARTAPDTPEKQTGNGREIPNMFTRKSKNWFWNGKDIEWICEQSCLD